MQKALLCFLSLWLLQPLMAQKGNFSRADSLLGYLYPQRACYDVHYYALNVTLDPAKRRLQGYSSLSFTMTAPADMIQIDLGQRFRVDAIVLGQDTLSFTREFTALHVALPRKFDTGESITLTVHYQGQPKVAENAPWDGGFVFDLDEQQRPWIAVACEGEGASSWWPCKDHFTDEPDSVRMTFNVPKELTAVGNGRLEGTADLGNGFKAYSWMVRSPINLYNVTLNAAHYAHFSAPYLSQESGDSLSLDYYVLDYNLDKAKRQFQQVTGMMDCFEEAFGGYPFYIDGYKLVETPYLGMEHQSAIAYGNQYKPGYLGFDMSGLGFDYIIIHETGHEWFGNSLTAPDIADLWIHESFTTYSEAVYVECRAGKARADQYMRLQRMNVLNRKPIIGPRDVHFDGWIDDNDLYYKGALMLHTLRTAMDDDARWKELLKAFTTTYRHSIVATEEVIRHFNEGIEWDVAPFFRQYLTQTSLPKLEYAMQTKGKKTVAVEMRWVAQEAGFLLPVPYTTNKGDGSILVGTDWVTVPLPGGGVSDFSVELGNYYVRSAEVER